MLLIGQVSQTTLRAIEWKLYREQTAEFLKHDPNSIHAQIAAWNSVLASAVNDSIREKASQQIQRLTAALQAQKNVVPSPTPAAPI